MEQAAKNMILEKRINELEEALNPIPLFMTPSNIKAPESMKITSSRPH